jgi:tRNA(Ser,Leu) C12 N-acetylase TAN1
MPAFELASDIEPGGDQPKAIEARGAHAAAGRAKYKHMDLLVSHGFSGYGRAAHEIVRVLKGFGDPQPQVEKTRVPGICVVRTCLDNRDVVARCRELYDRETAFRFAIKWVPVDYSCEKDLDAIRQLLQERIAPRIAEQETWAMEVQMRGWREHRTAQVVEHLAAAIDRPVNLRSPDKLVRVDILDGRRPSPCFGRERSRRSTGCSRNPRESSPRCT